MLSGWIILDKPLGLGSTQAVAAVKRNLREAGIPKTKVGHGGTLDPLATGVLPIALGEATKLAGRMLDASKIYEFTILFGAETDTLDGEGEVILTSEHRPSLPEVEAVLPQFTGAIEQIPPKYSALKIDGKRAYDLARAGEKVEMKVREVQIFSLSVNSSPKRGGGPRSGGGAAASAAVAPPHPSVSLREPPPRSGEELQTVTLTAHVSKGTYIRSLARDIAVALGTVGHVSMLRRTKAGPFSLEQAISLDKLNEIGEGAAASNIILPMEAGLDDIPVLNLSPEQARAVREGRVVTGIATDDGFYWARDAEMRPVALIGLLAGTLKIIRGFNI